MQSRLRALQEQALKELATLAQPSDLEAWRVKFLGRKSPLNQILRGLASVPIEERKALGALANQVKASLQTALETQEQALRQAELALLGRGPLGRTLPGP